MVTRRGFLKGLLTTPLAVGALSKLPQDVFAATESIPAIVTLQANGTKTIATGGFGKALWPGVRDWYGNNYNDLTKSLVRTKEEIAARIYNEAFKNSGAASYNETL